MLAGCREEVGGLRLGKVIWMTLPVMRCSSFVGGTWSKSKIDVNIFQFFTFISLEGTVG